MATGKLFIGRKVRELRLQGNMTQSQCAERLGISTSYLNQIENNQRPVSAAVLLALAEKFQLDLSDLSSGVTGEIHFVDNGYNILSMPIPEMMRRGDPET